MAYKSIFRVYYEDTDAGGVVYHSNYLKFAERARTEMLRQAGVNQTEIAKSHAIYFVVRDISVQFIKPAMLDDELEILTKIEKIGAASMLLLQDIICNYAILSSLQVKIACVTKEENGFSPCKIPNFIVNKLDYDNK